MIVAWALGALAVQRLSLWPLLGLAVMTVFLFGRSPQTLWPAFTRMRWLFVALLATHGWTLPGVAVMDAVWAPTWQGLAEGLAQSLRLLILVWWLRRIWLVSGRDGFLGALYLLFRPFRRLGLPAATLACRLGLTLHYADRLLSLPRPVHWRQWPTWLAESMAQTGPDEVELTLCRWRVPDWVLVGLAVAIATGMWA
ncbi:hypothetical protein [Gulbenkiania mobilis]